MSTKPANFNADWAGIIASGVGLVGSSTATADGAGMLPYFIAVGETFVVPLYKQAPKAMPIDIEGILDIEGFVIEVD